MNSSFAKGIQNRILDALPDRVAVTVDYLYRHGSWPNLDHPKRFCEKIMRRKLVDRDPRMPLFADKILGKEMVRDLLGPHWIIPTLWSGDHLPQQELRNWPTPYVLKASHASGCNYFVRSEAEQSWPEMEVLSEHWLRTTHARQVREWLYSEISPRLLVEPMVGPEFEHPADYKFFVFDGKPEFVQVDLGRYTVHEQHFFDMNWVKLPWTYVAPMSNKKLKPPVSFSEMKSAASKLGQGFKFVRVDLYEVEERPLFGELTFYPNSGQIAFKPESVELELGALWQ